MSNIILVTYASRAGATAGVAEAIAETLREKGATVVVHPMQEVKNLAAYRAVVVGSAIQDRQWLPEATQFVRLHRAELLQKPVATFSVCMTLAMKHGEKYHDYVASWLQPVRALVKPMSEGYFAGVLDISKIPSFNARLRFRVSVLFGVWKEGDHRDWKAIHDWASKLAAKLN